MLSASQILACVQLEKLRLKCSLQPPFTCISFVIASGRALIVFMIIAFALILDLQTRLGVGTAPIAASLFVELGALIIMLIVGRSRRRKEPPVSSKGERSISSAEMIHHSTPMDVATRS